MKKYATVVLSIICILSLIGCNEKKNKEILHVGLNAVIKEIDASNNILYVTGVDEYSNEIFGDRCALDCTKVIENQDIIYVNYNTNDEIIFLQLGDLMVGDDITLIVYDDELTNKHNSPVDVEQIQLSTQRLN